MSRVGPWFRRRDIHYDEIQDLGAAIAELEAARFLDTEPDADPALLLHHLLRREIEELSEQMARSSGRAQTSCDPTEEVDCSCSGVGEQLACSPGRSQTTPGVSKAALIEALAAASRPDILRAAIHERVPLIAPRRLGEVALYRLLFFGNLHQDWSVLVLADLGVFRYESYELHRDLRLFPTRAAIDDAIAVRDLRERARLAIEGGDGRAAWSIAAAVARRDPPWHPTSRAIADAALLEVAALLERAGAREEALELYAAATAPPARERCARLEARLGRERRAIAICREIAAAPRDESERVFAARFEQRLRRSLGQAPPSRRRYRRVVRLALAPDPARAVEDLALDHYAARGQRGFHSENWLWLALYGLALWDVVFAPVEGAFEHAYQDGPLDLEEPSFRARRESAITARLDDLAATAEPAGRLLATWDDKQGLRNRLVPWGPAVRERIELALSRLSGRHLGTVLDRLSRDLGRYRRGLPDLFVLTPQAPGFQLLEVKGPGDHLRPEQIGWLDYLATSGIPCSVLSVEWSSGAPGGMRFAAVESSE